jgi:choline dehydrogenase
MLILKDHPAIGVTRKLSVPSSNMLNSPAKNDVAVQDYLRDGTGPLASTGGEVVCKSQQSTRSRYETYAN